MNVKNSKIALIVVSIIFLVILMSMIVISIIINKEKQIDDGNKLENENNIQNEVIDIDNKKTINNSLIDINFLKNDDCDYLDFYGINIIGPEIFSITNCGTAGRSFSLINNKKQILNEDFQNGITLVYDDFFVDASSFNGGNSGYKFKLYDKNGFLKLEEDRATIFSKNLIFIGDNSSRNGKLYNVNNYKYSDNYKILQYVQDNAILIKDVNNSIKIINSEFEIIKDFGITSDEYILLNDNYIFNQTTGKIINFKNNKISDKKYEYYYPLYNDYIEVCENEKCGVINIDTEKLIVPIKYEDSLINFNYDDLTENISRKFDIINNNLIIIDNKYIYNFNGKKLFDLKNESYISTINNNHYIIEEYNNENTVKKIKIFDINGKITFEDELYNSFYTEYTNYSKYIAYDKAENKENSKYGIVDINGNVFMEFKYDHIDIYDGFYILELNNEHAIYNYNNEEILAFGNYDIEWQNSNNKYDVLMIQNLDTDDLQMLVTTFQ